MSKIDPEQIQWTHIRTEDRGGGPEYTYRAENVEHAGCGGYVHLVHLRNAMGGLLSAHSQCAKCGEGLTP